MTVEAPAAPILLHPIGVVHSPYRTKDEVPKGLGAKHAAPGAIEIFPEFAAGLADIEGFSHLYVLWIFDRAGDYELLGRDGATLSVRGVDMLDGSPVVDLKPYLSSIPPEKLRRGWLDAAEAAAKTPD